MGVEPVNSGSAPASDTPEEVLERSIPLPPSAQSSAFLLLDRCQQEGELNAEEVEHHKKIYTRLQAHVLETYQREKELLKQAKTLNSDLLTQKINVEKQSIRCGEELAAYASVDKQKENALKELAEMTDRDAVLTFELTEVQREQADLLMQKREILAAHAKCVEPEIEQLTNEVQEQARERERVDIELTKEEERKVDLLRRQEILTTENLQLETKCTEGTKRLQQIQQDPERMEKQADVVQLAVDNLKKDVAKAKERIQSLDESITSQDSRLKEADTVQKELTQKLDVHRETIDQRQRDVDHVTMHLREEQNRHVLRLSEKARLEMDGKALDLAVRRENERKSKAQKQYDRSKRELKKQIILLDNNRALLPNAKTQVADARHQVASVKAENRQKRKEQVEVKQQVDLLIARFLKQEEGEKFESKELDQLTLNVREMEEELNQWMLEETKQKKLVALLTAQREVKAREAASALAAEKTTQQELKMKELLIIDLAKKWHEKASHLKEFSCLYDVVKNERNKYVSLIQSSTQALAEMKEKIKILQNEVEVLRHESAAKEQALGKEKLAHGTAQCSRDSLRLDTNRSHEQYRQKQEQVEQQIVEIDKLNGIITQIERQLLRLKKQYEQAVDARNLTGVQLIERNDELCLLYEKANVQEKALGEGEVGLTQKDQEIRMLKLQLGDLERQVILRRQQLPHLPKLAQRILQVQEELQQEKAVTELLCRDLETPQNGERWRELEGDDPDEDQLAAKVSFIESRYHKKKEQLLEKELVLEEVTNLANKLRTQAMDRRGETLELTKKMNDVQGRIKETTRKMMAIVSELSMYQATAMKLQQEKQDASEDLSICTQRIEKGQVPNAAAQDQLNRVIHQRMREQEQRYMRQQQKVTDDHARNFPTQLTYTSAEPRPNAYIPEQLGIPKPYGAYAPFKPTEAGSTMRHIRPPEQQDIEI